MKTNTLILAISTVALITSCSKDHKKPPNVVIMLADDLGYDDLSCYRVTHPDTMDQPPTAMTPRIDKLAESGMRFTDFYAGAAVCSPSRSALITGRNATRVGIYNWIPSHNPMHLRNREITIAEMLRAHGYSTGHFGKWHLTSEGMGQPLPNDQGFDYSFFAYNNAMPSHRNPENYFRNGKPVGKLQGYACQLVMDEALGWLDTAKNSGEPFFLNIWFNEPHRIVAAPPELAERHAYNQEYYGCIENMDLAVGRLLDYLDQHNLRKNTIIIFTSDNGANWKNSNMPLRGEKALNFEGGIREPFMISFPGTVPRESVSRVPGSFTDVMPTLAALTGAKLPDDRIIDGVSLEKVIRGSKEYPERKTPIFFYRYFHDPVIMLRQDDWCLLGYVDPIPWQEYYDIKALAKIKPDSGQPEWSQWGFQENHMAYLLKQKPTYFELYNLREDVAEKHDISAEHPELFRSMIDKALQLKKEMVSEGGNWYPETAN